MLMRKIAGMSIFAVAGLMSAGSAGAMSLTSPDVKPGATIAAEQVFNDGGCKGENVSPALAWAGAPKATKSFAVSMYDPDAPTGGGFWHWWVADLPPDTTGLPRGAGGGTGLPAGALQARNGFGQVGYGGPCPPPGRLHRYRITVYALDVDKLPGLGPGASPAAFESDARAHALAKATLTGLYGR